MVDFTELLSARGLSRIEVDERLAVYARDHGPDGCRLYLEDLRWPGGVECPRCESSEVHWLERRARHSCRQCHYQFRVTAQTVFHDSHLSLAKWFAAVALMLSTPDGIPAVQLRRILGGSYKSAWFLEHRIRSAMGARTMLPAVPTAYAAAQPSKRQASRAAVAVTAEPPPGWPLLRSVIAGAHGNVRAKYLAAYWDEARWRHDNQDNPNAFRDTVFALLHHPWLPYDELTAG